MALAAVVLETAADEQKRRQRASAAPGEFVASGLWAWCRHPNYLGEVAFWWGIFGFALAAGWGHAWTVAGAVAMTLLFRLVSVPLMDRRMASRYPGYAAFAASLPGAAARCLPRRCGGGAPAGRGGGSRADRCRRACSAGAPAEARGRGGRAQRCHVVSRVPSGVAGAVGRAGPALGCLSSSATGAGAT